MKKLLFGAIALFLAAGFVSCKDDDPTYYYSYGTVVTPDPGNGDMRIRKDAGAYLFVEGWTGGLRVGDRVLVVYEVKGKLNSGGDNTVKLRSIYWILTKDPLLRSELTVADNLALGNDGLLSVYPWLGGEYLNVYFSMYFSYYTPPVTHLINLVADDVDYDGTTITVTLRHNAYGEVPGYSLYFNWFDGMASFNLVNLFADLDIPQASYPNIVLKWEQYMSPTSSYTSTVTKSLGKFVPWGGEVPAAKADIGRTTVSVE